MAITEILLEKFKDVAVDIVKEVPKTVPKIIAAGGVAIGGAVAGYAAGFKKADKGKKEFGKKLFALGLKEGNKLASKKARKIFIDPYLAKIALVKYVLQADNKITNKEQKILDGIVKDFESKYELPKSIQKELNDLLTNELAFDIVENYLNSLEIDKLEEYKGIIESTIESNKKATYKETMVVEEFNGYFNRRKNDSINKEIENILDNKENENDPFLLLTNDEIEKSVEEYSLRYSLLESKFERKTKLNKSESALVVIATALQLTRIYLINEMSVKEKANEGKKEKAIKEKQNEILGKFDIANDKKMKRYYAPMEMIITTKGVPYDTQRYEEGKKLGLFKGKTKGVNHRFATLGHDPLVGLLVGTINIMTNTITSTKNKIPTTYHVGYENDYKNPCILSSKASFVKALNKSIDRTKDDPKPFVASFIKQLLHIASDTYTIAGIQIPGSSLVLDENTVEKFTKVISFGDVFKFGSSLTLEVLINVIIQLVHLVMINDEGGDITDKLNSIKTKKIIDYSDYIATYSNVISTTITERYERIDLAGLAVMTRKLFNDINFLYDVKDEFINEGLKEVYK